MIRKEQIMVNDTDGNRRSFNKPLTKCFHNLSALMHKQLHSLKRKVIRTLVSELNTRNSLHLNKILETGK